MATRDITASHAPFPAGPRPFESILFERAPEHAEIDEPDFFGDLNLDQLLEAMTGGREQYRLEPFFYEPLHDLETVDYRHEALRDLERPDIRQAVTSFAERMRRMRDHLKQVEKLHHRLQKQAWFLDAVGLYCEAVSALGSELAESDPASRGFRALCDHLAGYVASEAYRTVAEETSRLKEDLAAVHYAVRIQGARVTVTKLDGEPDYGAEVEEAFAKFKQGSVKNYLVNLPDHADMNHVEAQILDCVAHLYPDLFTALARYCKHHGDYLDARVARFDREVQFYLAYLELIERLKDAGLSFCYPDASTTSQQIVARDTFDIALANKLGGNVVCNDFDLEQPERVFVVTGPNNGGKTTFARTVGQLHYLASLGLQVPGRAARLFLPDRIYTHFEREEDIETLRGKFEDELVRVHGILEQATSRSVVVMNESFSSTSLNDALFVGTEVVRRILELGAVGVYVTFVDEIASLSEATVSMVAQVAPDNPAERSFRLVRKPADGLAYAWAISQKYGLTYDRLVERIDP